MKLVVGLGNPGRKYDNSRHNIGFDVLAEIARKHQLSAPKAKFDGNICEFNIEDQRVILLWPQTFMNLSGTSVGKAKDFYKLDTKDILIVCDDFHLPLAKLRFRSRGSAGGQKGLADIIRRLGSEEFSRLRVGVGPLPEGWEAASFVLGKFRKEEGQDIEQAVWRSADAVKDWVLHDIDFCMNQYN